MAQFSLELLGGFRATVDGQLFTGFRSQKVRALLIYLLVEDAFAGAPLPHRREGLMALLWPEMGKRRAHSNLRQTLYYLRRALRELGKNSFLLSDRQTVRVNPAARYHLDVAVFLDSVSKTARHEHGELEICQACLRALENAATAYAGDFLEDFKLPRSLPFEEWALVKQEALRQQALDGMQTLANAYLRQERYEEAQAVARRQLEIDPLRELAHGQMMEALARAGKRTAALRQYDACVAVLQDALDVEPSPAIEALYQAIVDATFTADRAVLGRISGDSSASGSSPVTRPLNLPQPSSPFIGRRRELADVRERLGNAHCRLLTVFGLGGIGKTRLALAAAEGVAGDFRDGVFYVPLAGLSSAQDLASTIGNVVGAPSGSRTAQEQLLHYLQDKELLLLLDNYEQLLPEVSLLTLLLERCFQVKMVVTSRARLQLRREWIYDLSGLAVQGEDDGTGGEASALFLYHARRVNAGFEADASTMRKIAEICRTVEGVPLAIELAAAAVRHRKLDEIAAQVRRDVASLSSGAQDIAERHRSMEAAFDHSWNLLGREKQEVFARLSVFRGAFTVAAAEAVAKGTERVLAALAENSILRRQGNGRYDIHTLLRQFGERKLAKMEKELGKTVEHHMRYYAETILEENPGTPAARRWIRDNLDNVRQAWDVAMSGSAIFTLSQMVMPLAIFYYGNRRLHEEAMRRFAAAVAAVRRLDEADQPEVQRVLGQLIAWRAYFTFEDEERFDLASEAVQLLRPIGAQPELALALSLRGYAAQGVGRVEDAVDDLQEGRAMYEALGDPLSLTASLNALAEAYAFLGAYEAAEEYGERCAAISDQIALDKMSSIVRTHLSNVLRVQGAYKRAEARAAEALRLAEEIGSVEHKIIALFRLAEAAFDDGRYGEVERWLSTALEIPDLAWEQPAYHVQALALYGKLRWRQQRVDEAEQYFIRALTGGLALKSAAVLPYVLMALVPLLEKEIPARAADLLNLLSDHYWSAAEIRTEAEARLDRLVDAVQADAIDIERQRVRGADLREIATELREWLAAEASG